MSSVCTQMATVCPCGRLYILINCCFDLQTNISRSKHKLQGVVCYPTVGWTAGLAGYVPVLVPNIGALFATNTVPLFLKQIITIFALLAQENHKITALVACLQIPSLLLISKSKKTPSNAL